MASTSDPTSKIPTDSGSTLHPTLLGISRAMRKAELERKERLDLV